MPAQPSFILLVLRLVVAAFAAIGRRFALQAGRENGGLENKAYVMNGPILLRAANGSAIEKTSSGRPLPAAQAASSFPAFATGQREKGGRRNGTNGVSPIK